MKPMSCFRVLALAMLGASAWVALPLGAAEVSLAGEALLTREARIAQQQAWDALNLAEYRQPHQLYRHRPPAPEARESGGRRAERGIGEGSEAAGALALAARSNQASKD